MKVALVHDYLNDFGGAERVLMALAEIWPDAPIYTAFYRPNSLAYQRFSDRDIRTSWAQKVPFFKEKLHSPLRFMAPMVWESFNFDEYDVVISSSSWYMPKGVLTRPETLHICYCHTPPRYLYGFNTSIDWKKSWFIRRYADLVNPFMREYDYLSSQRVDEFIANSKNVAARINKFYRRDSRVIYPPAEIDNKLEIQNSQNKDYYLVISRLVGGKGLPLVVEAANRARVPLKIVGAPSGWSSEHEKIKEMAGGTIEFLGYVADDELASLYANAKAFLALAEDEDFGITPVEAMSVGTPVIAYRGGGYKETIIEGKTGIFVDELTAQAVTEAMEKLEAKGSKFDREFIKNHAKQFSKDRFIKEIKGFVEAKWKEHRTKLHLEITNPIR